MNNFSTITKKQAEKMAIFISLLAIAIGLAAIAGIQIQHWILREIIIVVALILALIGAGQLIPYTITSSACLLGEVQISFRLPLRKKNP